MRKSDSILVIFVFIIYRSRLCIYYFKYFDFSDDIFYKQYKYRRNLQPKIVESVICAGIRISIPPNPDKPQSVHMSSESYFLPTVQASAAGSS